MRDSAASKSSGQRICVSIAAQSVKAALAAARKATGAAVVEIRLDALEDQEIAPFIAGLRRPLLFTNRPMCEGGAFGGPEKQRLQPLLAAIQAGAAYVDIELRTAAALRRQLLTTRRSTASKTKVIVSWHDFAGTPSSEELARVFYKQYQSGAQIGKIVTMAHDYLDAARVLALLPLARKLNFPLIAFCMGEAGMISRLATLEQGGYMTYAAPDSGEGTAPGQLPVSTLRALLAGRHDV